MKTHRTGRLLGLIALILFLPALGQGPPPGNDHKQAQKQLKTAVKVMTKEQAQEHASSLAWFKDCLEGLRDDVESGVPPDSVLPALRDCLATFVNELAVTEIDCDSAITEQAGDALGKIEGNPHGFLHGDGGLQDHARDKLRARTDKRIDQGLKLVSKALDKPFLDEGYAFVVRALVPDMDGSAPIPGDVLEDLRRPPFIAVMVAGSSLTETDDGLLFVAGYGMDPDAGPGKDAAPTMDTVQFECRTGTATQNDVPLTALDPLSPVGPDNPPVRWAADFTQLDEPLLAGSLPEGNGIVRAEQNGVVATATIGIP